MIPAQAVEAAAKEAAEADLQEWDKLSEYDQHYWRWITKHAIEAAAPHMQKGDGENRPGWDDRKKLSGIWQEHAPLPVEGLSERVYEALIEVAAWGYQQRMDEEL